MLTSCTQDIAHLQQNDRHCLPCRYEKRHSNTPAHISPCFRCREGDNVVIGQCRPLSKTVRFNVLRVIPQGASSKKGFSSF